MTLPDLIVPTSERRSRCPGEDVVLDERVRGGRAVENYPRRALASCDQSPVASVVLSRITLPDGGRAITDALDPEPDGALDHVVCDQSVFPPV